MMSTCNMHLYLNQAYTRPSGPQPVLVAGRRPGPQMMSTCNVHLCLNQAYTRPSGPQPVLVVGHRPGPQMTKTCNVQPSLNHTFPLQVQHAVCQSIVNSTAGRSLVLVSPSPPNDKCMRHALCLGLVVNRSRAPPPSQVPRLT